MREFFKVEVVETVVVEATGIDKEERVITLKEIVEIINKEEIASGDFDAEGKPRTRHRDAIKKVKKLAKEPSFGTGRKIRVVYNTKGQEMETYHFTKKQAIAASAKINNKYLIFVIDELERTTKELAQLRGNTPTLQLPDFTDSVLMARTWADQEEKNRENQKLLSKKYEELEIAISLAKHADESSIREFVKDLAIDRFGLKTCFTWLRERSYMMKNGEPYQKWVNKGYFTMKPWKEDKDEIAHFQLMFTELGKRELGDIIRKEFSEPEKVKDAKGGTL